ncbi:putative transcriptional regulator [Sporomusaceae bacterium BoRhaA]|uniref:GTP cyclohydrolase n=1 Tax=Pelorhabdus rhamnosifermentans TaxID=2772457 RepID=UPI001C063437|nr:GTP cyclohydrolase [Pelorhabdus rhamnosifermentans]MBU2703584.1 putative transcriptional regulator [Pelorhabdus rhamnosifermentans]
MRKITIAVVGPADSVQLISEVAKEYSEKIDIMALTYKVAEEVPTILAAHNGLPDGWLFSGKVPYSHAIAANIIKQPMLSIPHAGSSLYRVLLEIANQEKLDVNRISFDMVSEKDIAETLSDLEVPLDPIRTFDCEGIVSAADMTEYHYQLWKSGKTKLAVTSFYSTYYALKDRGIPVFRIRPLRSNVRTALDMAYQMVEAVKFKSSQISIQQIVIDDYAGVIRDASSTYEVKRLEAKLYPLLIQYTEMVQGSIDIHGPGHYTIYSTRGAVEEVTQGFTVVPIQEQLTQLLSVPVSGGIGFGPTAHAAEKNAYKALGFARHTGKGHWMVVLDEGTVLGPLSSDTYLKYSLRPDASLSQCLAKQLQISVTTMNRLLASLDKLDTETIGADELATPLSITPRSARRLLGILVEHGLAEVSHEEALYKGRPRKIYRLLVDKIVQKHGSL